ncbi:MAG: hypothetical protein M0Z36_02600 [Thermaerobacter sp.]|nr:hypothetical protein [Thermaerobacter sp.]
MVIRKRWMVVAGSALVLLGLYVFRTYPRSVAVTLHGVQYKLGTPKQGVTPVTLTLHGTRERSMFGPETFHGIVDIYGATMPDRTNGKYLTIPFEPHFGGLLVYYSRSNQFREYGAIYPNGSFTKLVVQEWQHSSWSGADGLVVAAPARTRAQALRLSNKLMKSFLFPGHPLK